MVGRLSGWLEEVMDGKELQWNHYAYWLFIGIHSGYGNRSPVTGGKIDVSLGH